MPIRRESRNSARHLLGVLGTLLLAVVGLACQYGAVADECDPYDCDDDGLSTVVELDSLNRPYFDTSRFDPDPSLARGLPDSGGRLVFGIHLPDTQNFTSPWSQSGYYHHFGSDTTPYYDDDWGTLALVRIVERS